VERLRALGVQKWQENKSPGESFYFLDPDGHKLEIHDSNLRVRLQALKANPPKELVFFLNLLTFFWSSGILIRVSQHLVETSR
jgi:hypothetical protein